MEGEPETGLAAPIVAGPASNSGEGKLQACPTANYDEGMIQACPPVNYYRVMLQAGPNTNYGAGKSRHPFARHKKWGIWMLGSLQ